MELKFRAWDRKKKVMTYFGDDLLWFEEHAPEWRYEYKIMQYTGLKDRNGKEIYEKDIIKHLENGSYPDKYIYSVVIWSDKGGCWTLQGRKSYTRAFPILTGFYKKEVVGNIYENPELLQKAEKLN